MKIAAFAPIGFEGSLVTVEVDLRRGIPCMEVIGLPDSAVRESRDRVRAAIKNSGFEFPQGKILINLSPAGVRKEGASYDLAIACAVLEASGQVQFPGPLLALGELSLSGSILSVHAVLAAVSCGLKAGLESCIVANDNAAEASLLDPPFLYGIDSLKDCLRLGAWRILSSGTRAKTGELVESTDFSWFKGQTRFKRGLEIAAAGRHNLVVTGPPGCGKSMGCRSMQGILPSLSPDESLEVTLIHSLAGLRSESLITEPQFRNPHHSSSLEGLAGGGRLLKPGEVSLAHHGVLFLDEAPEFRADALQALREPMELGRITLSRAGQVAWFPADFQLLLASNLCPCGAFGSDKVCTCSIQEIRRYQTKLGAALLDRMDLRILIRAEPDFLEKGSEPTKTVRARVMAAVEIQHLRFRGYPFRRNARIPSGLIAELCRFEPEASTELAKASTRLSLSARAIHSVQKVAITISDLDGSEIVRKIHILEALDLRESDSEESMLITA